jgi:hypothetical protein
LIFLFVNIVCTFSFANNPEKDESSHAEKASVKVQDWKFGLCVQWFRSRSDNTYLNALESAGLKGKDARSGETLASPRKVFFGMRANIYIERLIKNPFTIGGLVTFYKSAEFEGCDPDNLISIDIYNLDIGYYIYGLPHTDRDKSPCLQAGFGLGATKTTYIAEALYDADTIRQDGPQPNITNWSSTAIIFCGIHINLSKKLYLGRHLNYWYVSSITIDPSTINYRGLSYQFPDQKISFGGFSIGIAL